MLRFWFVVLVVLSLAACSSAPPKVSRAAGGTTASENAWRTAPPGLPRFVDHSTGREEISIQAMSLVGIPYKWGGNTPDSGFDCSGLVRYVVARAADVNLPRTTADISRRGEAIEPDAIAPGDLIFFNTTGRPHSHVGIYAGKLRFVNAPSTGGTVRLDYLTNPYWAKRFDGIRRVAAPVVRPSPFDGPTELAGARVPVPTIRKTPAATVATRDPIDAAADAPGPSALAAARTEQQATTAAALLVPSRASAPADAFEPSALAAARTEQEATTAAALLDPSPANAPEPDVQIRRASTRQQVQGAPTSAAGDPIAQFANSRE